MPDRDGFVPFVVATAAVCFPTYVLIGILNTPSRVNRIKSILSHIFGRKPRESEHRSTPQRTRSEIGYMRPVDRPVVTSYAGMTSPSAYARRPSIGSEGNEPARPPSLSSPSGRAVRETTVKFDTAPSKSRSSISQDGPAATKFEHAPLSPRSPTSLDPEAVQQPPSSVFQRLSRAIRWKERPGLPV